MGRKIVRTQDGATEEQCWALHIEPDDQMNAGDRADSCVHNMTRWSRVTDWKRKCNYIQKRKDDSLRTVLGGKPSRFIDLLTYRLPRSSLASSTPVVMSCFCITGACTILSGYNIPDTFYEMFYLIASPGTWLFSPFLRTIEEVN